MYDLRPTRSSFAAVFCLCLVVCAGCASNGGPDAKANATRTTEDLEREVARLEGKVRRNPGQEERLYALGNAYFDLGRYTEAREVYRRLVEVNPARADAWCNLGLTHKRMGNFVNAVTAYERALDLEPRDAVTLRNYVTLLQQTGNIERGLGALETLAELEPDDAAAQLEYAAGLARAGRYAEAEPRLRALLEDPAVRAEAAQQLGACLFDRGELAQARDVWREALAQYPNHPGLHRALAVVYWQLGDFPAAWAQVETCRALGIELDPAFLSRLEADSPVNTAP